MEKSVTNHEGKEFASITEMCEFHGIGRRVYMQRIRRGWSKEKALTTPVAKHATRTTLSEKERQRIYNKTYYAKNKEREKKRLEKYRKAHKEELKATDKIYRQEHEDEIRAYQKAYRNDEAHKEKAKVYQKAYREKKRKEERAEEL